MRRRAEPNFDEWVQYVFQYGHDDFWQLGHVRPELRAEPTRNFTQLGPVVTASYLTKLFRESSGIVDRFTPDQIARVIWLIFGGRTCSSDSISCIWDKRVDVVDAEECIRSMKSLYTDCIDRLCELDGTSSGRVDRPSRDLEIAVYMLWDMGPLDLGPSSTRREAQLSEAALEVIEVALMECRSEACRSSALHAIGHAVGKLEYWERDRYDPALAKEFVGRLRELVRAFLETPGLTTLLRDYAAKAHEGSVG